MTKHEIQARVDVPVILLFGLSSSFGIYHSSFQSSFIKFDQIEISPDIFAAFAAGLFEKM